MGRLNRKDNELVRRLVQKFEKNRQLYNYFLEAVRLLVTSTPELMADIHSLRWRLKDPGHLKEKLKRKISEARDKGRQDEISEDNFFEKINDLAGLRLIHLHTGQLQRIDETLKRILSEQRYSIREGPNAKTWDDENRVRLEQMGMYCEKSTTMYTSVHYVIGSYGQPPLTMEIQVRTLSEELWGEVDHDLNYPKKSKSVACQEQIIVLARVTSSCSRLVDSIFTSHEEMLRWEKRLERNRSKSR